MTDYCFIAEVRGQWVSVINNHVLTAVDIFNPFRRHRVISALIITFRLPMFVRCQLSLRLRGLQLSE